MNPKRVVRDFNELSMPGEDATAMRERMLREMHGPLGPSNASSVARGMEIIDRHIAAQSEAQEAPTARRAVKHLMDEIQQFEAALDEQSEVGIRLSSFGTTVLVYVSEITYRQPNLLIFGGQSDGNPVRLVQHLSQLSFLLVRAPRLAPDKPRKPIGFRTTSGD